MGFLDSIRALLGSKPPAPISPSSPTKTRVTFRAEVVSGPRESAYLAQEDHARLLQRNTDGLAPVHFVRRNGALWLAEDTTGKLLNVDNRYLRRLGIWGVKVRGKRYYDGEARIGPASLVRAEQPARRQRRRRPRRWPDDRPLQQGHGPALTKLLDAGEPREATVISTDPAKVLTAHPEVLAHLRRHL